MAYDYTPEQIDRYDWLAQVATWRLKAQNAARNAAYWKTRAEHAERTAQKTEN